jgi:basic amino acid/polyamine antiporter, APA family
MQATLGLTGLTSNAMALIAPGAFLGSPSHPGHHRRRRPAIHRASHVDRHLRRPAALPGHRGAYAEISKLYPGTGSSYYYAEQALLSKDKASSTPASPSSSSAGARTFTTGSIPA